MRDADRLSEVLAVLDVGHGSSAVLFSGGAVAVFDAGLRSGLLEFLTEQKVKHIHTVFVSHADQDHIAGILGVLASQTVEISRVVVNSDCLKQTDTWDDLCYELDRARNAGELRFDIGMVAGHAEDIGKVSVAVIGPTPYLAAKSPGSTDSVGRKISSNSISAVFRLCRDSEPVVTLPGDVDSVGLDDLLRVRSSAGAPTLVFPHHGGRQGTRDVAAYVGKLVGLVQPQTVIFSIGRGEHRTPNPELVASLRQVTPETRIVCTQLSEHCARSVPSVAPSHLCNVFSLGRADKACCAGTVLVDVADPSRVSPTAVDHIPFVKTVTETPLCLA